MSSGLLGAAFAMSLIVNVVQYWVLNDAMRVLRKSVKQNIELANRLDGLYGEYAGLGRRIDELQRRHDYK